MKHAVTPSPYLTTEEAAQYLRYSSPEALRMAIKRLGIPVIKRGHRTFFTTKLLDEFMATREAKPAGRSTRTKGR